MLVLKPPVISELNQLALTGAPSELVGIIDGVGKLFLLTNTSDTPHNSFEVDKQEILSLFSAQVAQLPEQSTLWHTHPSGLVGPSRIDMQQRTVFPYHLVVTVQGSELIHTWY